MKHFATLDAIGYAGTSARDAFVFNLTSKRYHEASRKRGKFRGLVALRGFEDFQESGNDPDAAIILAYKLIWPTSLNLLANWAGTGKAYTIQTPNQFGGNLSGLMYQRHLLSTPAQITSNWAYLANQPFSIRAELFNPVEAASGAQQPKARWRMRFGGGEMRWQFSIIDGRFELARLSANWTEAKQSTLDALEDIDEPTLANIDSIQALRGPIRREAGGTYSPDAIFESIDSLSLGSPVKHATGNFYELTFIPEPKGRLNVILSGSKAEFVDVPQVLAGDKPGIVTGAGPLSVWTSGPAFLLQVGRPAFVPKGLDLIGAFRRTGHSLNDFNTVVSADSAHKATPESEPYDPTLLGTDISIAATGLDPVTNENEPAGWFDFLATLTTTDNRFTPFLYSLQASYDATPRIVSAASAWSSSAQLDVMGKPPILDIEWNCDGANRQSSALIHLRDVKGTLFNGLPGRTRSALENRLASLGYGPTLASQTRAHHARAD